MAPAELRETLGKDAITDLLVNLDMRLRMKQNRPENTDDGITCYYCKEKGQFRRNCPKLKNKEANKNSDASAKKDGIERRICSEHRRKQRIVQRHVGGSTMINESCFCFYMKLR